MDKIEVVRSEVVEPSREINSLAAPTGGNASLKQKGNFGAIPHLSALRSLRTRHPRPDLITKLIEQTKSLLDGTGNPAMLPKLMARTLRQIEGK